MKKDKDVQNIFVLFSLAFLFIHGANGFFSSCRGDAELQPTKAAPSWQSAAKKGWVFQFSRKELTSFVSASILSKKFSIKSKFKISIKKYSFLLFPFDVIYA